MKNMLQLLITEKMKNKEINFSNKEIEILKYAISFLVANLYEAEDALDINLDIKLIEKLETKFYENSTKEE